MFSFLRRKPTPPRQCRVVKNGQELTWTIGDEISKENYEKFKDRDGIVCVGSYWEGGEEHSFFMKRSVYDEMQARVRDGILPDESSN